MSKDTILILDDDFHILWTLKTFLAAEGYTVKTVDTVEKFLKISAVNKISTFLIEYRVQGSKTLEAIQQAKEFSPEAYVMMITNNQVGEEEYQQIIKYFAESRNVSSGCRSTGRTSISVTVNTIPDAPTVSAQTFCGSATIAQLTGSAPAGCIIDWYAAASGGVALAPTALVATTTYFAQSRNISTGLVSLTRTAKTVSVFPNPELPTVANQTFNGSATVATLTGTAPGGCVIDWFTVGSGGGNRYPAPHRSPPGWYHVNRVIQQPAV